MRSSSQSPSHGSPHPASVSAPAIDRDGAFTRDVIDVPSGALVAGGTVASAPVMATSLGGKALFHFAASKTLVLADFDAADPAWTALPAAADAGHVASVWEDPTSHDLWAVKDDGAVSRATAAGGWTDWAAVDLGIALAAPTAVRPVAVARLSDGRMLVLAALADASPGAAADAPSLAGNAGWLLGPAR